VSLSPQKREQATDYDAYDHHPDGSVISVTQQRTSGSCVFAQSLPDELQVDWQSNPI
jgi:hypothetical protein